MALPILVEAPKEPSVAVQLEVAWTLAKLPSLLPTRFVASLFTKGLADASPATRLDALNLAEAIPPARAKLVLTRAIDEEPDAHVRRAMKNSLHEVVRVARGSTPARRSD